MTESDRELLELAAKAAGYDLQFAKAPGLAPEPYLRWKSRDVYWNPLTDDGDALRLAVKLFLFVDTAAGAPDSFGAEFVRAGNEVVDFVEPRSNCDPYAATRRAIVRAAAAIARATHKEGA